MVLTSHSLDMIGRIQRVYRLEQQDAQATHADGNFTFWVLRGTLGDIDHGYQYPRETPDHDAAALVCQAIKRRIKPVCNRSRFGFLIGMNVANSPQLPSWRPVKSFSQRGNGV